MEEDPSAAEDHHQIKKREPLRWLFWLGGVLAFLAWAWAGNCVWHGRLGFGTRSVYEAWTPFFGISAFIAALGVGVVAYRQLDTFRAQLSVMRRQLDAAYAAERPWIGFGDPDFSGLRASTSREGRFKGTVRFRAVNSGRRPARILAWRFTHHYAVGFKLPDYDSGRQSGRILVPGMRTTEQLTVELIPCVGPDGLEGQLYIFSEIVYEDLRTPGVELFTHLCMRSDPSQRLSFQGEFAAFEYDPEYNGAT